MASNRYLRLVEFTIWVVTASAMIIAASLALGLVVGRDLITGKYILFVVGFLLFGVGSLLIQPSRPKRAPEMAQQTNSENPEVSQLGPNEGSKYVGVTARDRAPELDSFRNQLVAPLTHEHRYEAMIQETGPLADHHLPFQQRIGREYKIFITSLVVLAFSLAMEIVGVHV